MHSWLTIVGIGEDGFAGLARAARRALFEAAEIHGGERHLAMLPARVGARRVPWPRPFGVDAVLARRPQATCVLASGDPMFHGVGAMLATRLPPQELRVLPAPSSASLAAARLGWALQEAEVVSLLTAPLATLAARLAPGRRLLVLGADGAAPAAVAALLAASGYGDSAMIVLERLGGPHERILRGSAATWGSSEPVAPLHLIALDCRSAGDAPAWPLTAGLPDAAYRHDGQLTKRDLRAMTLARLAPRAGELLWDVGAGAGSIGIEWMRAHPSCRAIAVEADPSRQEAIAHNGRALGAPALRVVAGRAPEALRDLPAPDAVFIGGGITAPGVLEACWSALRPGGRLVANAVTLQAEQRIHAWRAQHGGSLSRIQLAHAEPLGGFDAWRPVLPVVLYEAAKS